MDIIDQSSTTVM